MTNVFSLNGSGLTPTILPSGLSGFTAAPQPIYMEMRDAKIPADAYVCGGMPPAPAAAPAVSTSIVAGKPPEVADSALHTKGGGDEPGDERIDELIRKLHNDKNKKVRRAAAKSLGDIGAQRAVDDLTGARNGKRKSVFSRIMLAWSLLEIDHPCVMDLMIAAPSSDVRTSDAKPLDKRNHRLAMDALTAALEDKDWRVRRTAASALKKYDKAPVSG